MQRRVSRAGLRQPRCSWLAVLSVLSPSCFPPLLGFWIQVKPTGKVGGSCHGLPSWVYLVTAKDAVTPQSTHQVTRACTGLSLSARGVPLNCTLWSLKETVGVASGKWLNLSARASARAQASTWLPLDRWGCSLLCLAGLSRMLTCRWFSKGAACSSGPGPVNCQATGLL